MHSFNKYNDTIIFASFLLLFIYMLPMIPDAFGATGPEINMTRIKGDCFMMGSDSTSAGDEEKPVHEVCVDDFQIGTYEVSEAQWIAVMHKPAADGTSLGPDYPVRGVSWNDVREFISSLNRLTGKNYRLPTEAEWEFVARGGKQQLYSGTNEDSLLNQYACNSNNCKAAPLASGLKKPNSFGIYDMSGNVLEWVNDRFDSQYYRQSPKMNPKGDPFGVNRVLRGGSYNSVANQLRTTCREYLSPDIRKPEVGFRLAL